MKRLIVMVAIGAALFQTALSAQDAKKIADGKKIYEDKKCSECHFIAGKGKQKMSELDDVGVRLSEADIRSWLTNTAAMEAKLDHKPKVKMSSKKIPLTPAEVDAITAYMVSLKTKPVKK